MSDRTQKQVPVHADARLGFILGAGLWVLLVIALSYVHHLFTASVETQIRQVFGAALTSWWAHASISYVLLLTVAVDVFVDFWKMNDHKRYEIPLSL